MALEATFDITLAGGAAATVGNAHGLTHAGASRTPDFCFPIAWTGGTWQPSYRMTWDSVRCSMFHGVAQDAFVVGFIAKRCHTVEDRTGAL